MEIAIGVLGIIVLWQLYTSHKERKSVEKERQEWKTERSTLLDRIMTRNWETFVQAELARKNADKPMTEDDLDGYRDILPVN